VASKAGLDPLQAKRHVPSMRVDPDATGGVVTLGAVRGSLKGSD
jgi:hypothetical protein